MHFGCLKFSNLSPPAEKNQKVYFYLYMHLKFDVHEWLPVIWYSGSLCGLVIKISPCMDSVWRSEIKEHIGWLGIAFHSIEDMHGVICLSNFKWTVYGCILPFKGEAYVTWVSVCRSVLSSPHKFDVYKFELALNSNRFSSIEVFGFVRVWLYRGCAQSNRRIKF